MKKKVYTYVQGELYALIMLLLENMRKKTNQTNNSQYLKQCKSHFKHGLLAHIMIKHTYQTSDMTLNTSAI